MAPRLVALDDGLDILLDRAMIVVGRHPQCDVRLDSLRVSRHHCCMTVDQGAVLVRDLGSTNGIRINGHRVEFGRLQVGDELSIAHIRYRLVSSALHEATLADHCGSQNGHESNHFEPSKNGKHLVIASSPKNRDEPKIDGGEKGTDPAPESDEVVGPDDEVAAAVGSPLRAEHDGGEWIESAPANQNQSLRVVNGRVPSEKAIAEALQNVIPPEMADRCRIQVIVQMLDVEKAPVAE